MTQPPPDRTSGGNWPPSPDPRSQYGPPQQYRHNAPPPPQYGPPPGHPQQQQFHQPLSPRKPRRRWPWVLAGVALAFFVLIGGCMAVIGGTVATIASAGGGASNIRYELEGDGGASAITYATESGVEQITEADMPWSVDVPFDGTFMAAYVLSGGRGMDGATGPITCRITDADSGEVLAENTSDGEFATVSCQASPMP